MPFVIAPLTEVKSLNNWEEYIASLKALQAAAFARASALFNGATPGGLIPGDKQFGIGPFRKNDMAVDTADTTPSGTYTFRKNITSTGWQDIFNYTVRANMVHAFAGLLVSDNVLNITQFRMEIGSKRFPIWDIQEAQRYDKFAILLKEDVNGELVADQRTRMLVRIYAETIGFQRVVPLGFQIFRVADIVLTET